MSFWPKFVISVHLFLFWRKFVISTKICQIGQNLLFGHKFSPKFIILAKICHFDPNLSFWTKFVILAQICHFDPTLSFWPKFILLTKNVILIKILTLISRWSPQFLILTKICHFESRNFVLVWFLRKLQYVLMISNNLKNSFLGSIFEFYE